jgi:hypothetical protein
VNGAQIEHAFKMVVEGSRKSLIWLERETGIEPATFSLGSWRSATELLPQLVYLQWITEPT